MTNTYIFDTSVVIADPQAIKAFPDADIVLPIVLLEEIDKLKKQPNAAGKNARIFMRMLDEISDKGDISAGVMLENNAVVRVDTTDYSNNEFGNALYGDTRILACAYNINKSDKGNVILVSNDINLRVRGKVAGLLCQKYEVDNVTLPDLYTGVKAIHNNKLGKQLLEDGVIDEEKIECLPNEFIVFADKGGNEIAKGRKKGNKIKLVSKTYPWGITPRSSEQEMAIDLIIDPKIPLVTFIGAAGTGKSLISLGAGLELVINKKMYDKLVIYRPIQAVGGEIGFTPGPQPYDAKILTPDGWTTMGQIKTGSFVIGRDGKPTKVIGVFPKGTKSIYKITTTDGTQTECCEDHLWHTQTFENKKRQKPGSVKTTKEIINTLITKNGKPNHYLPRNEAIQFPQKELPLKPYTLGAILGDGHIGDTVCMIITDDDIEILDKVNKEIQDLGVQLNKRPGTIVYNFAGNLFNNKPAKQVKVTNILTNNSTIYNSIGLASQASNIKRGSLDYICKKNKIINKFKYEFLDCTIRWTNPIKNILHNLGLEHKLAWDKFIPDQYKYSTIEDRIELLRGLMDTDGTIKETGEASFATTSKQLALDIIEVVRSLGGRATLCERNRIGQSSTYMQGNHNITTRRISYEFTISLPQHINPFYISRKAKWHKTKYIHKIGIKSIEYIGEKEAQCILIENPEHLYITDDFIVTHNTIEEKLAPWFQAVMDNFELLFATDTGKWKSNFESYKKREKIQFEAMTYIRGRSIPNSLILIEEAQNISKEDIKTILTRVGENSKIILNGDIYQIDHNNLDAIDNGLTYVVEKFKKSPLAGHMTFVSGQRSALATEAANIL